MSRIFDNIETHLLPALIETLKTSKRADFCVGYFNLRGWKFMSEHIESLGDAQETSCRLLIGMHRPPSEELQMLFRLRGEYDEMDNAKAIRLKKENCRRVQRAINRWDSDE